MKKIFAVCVLAFFMALPAVISCQPNTTTTLQVGLVDMQIDKSYTMFMELKQDSISGSRLVDGMDYLNPDVSDLEVTLGTPYFDGDTTFYDIVIPDEAYEQFAFAGLIQVDNATLKYSAMTTYPYWQNLDSIEPQSAGFFIRRKP